MIPLTGSPGIEDRVLRPNLWDFRGMLVFVPPPTPLGCPPPYMAPPLGSPRSLRTRAFTRDTTCGPHRHNLAAWRPRWASATAARMARPSPRGSSRSGAALSGAARAACAAAVRLVQALAKRGERETRAALHVRSPSHRPSASVWAENLPVVGPGLRDVRYLFLTRMRETARGKPRDRATLPPHRTSLPG